MRRMLAIIVLCFFMIGVAGAEVDISSMNYEELVALKDQINLAIWNSAEWQEVEVPQGVWVVGEDIPAGKWTIKAPNKLETHIYWGDKLEESGVELSRKGKLYEWERIYAKDYRYYEAGDTTEVTWELKEGQYIIVEDGIALFTPYSGKPSLGFK